MEKIKLYLVVSGSKSYRSYARDEKLREWGYEPGSAVSVKNLFYVGRSDLFGKSYPSVIEAPTKESVANLLDQFNSLSYDNLQPLLSQGLIVLSECPLISAKKLQAKILDLGGESVAKTKDQQKNLGIDLFSGLSIGRDVREYLLSWAGEEPEKLLGVMGFLRSLPPEKQKQATVEDISIQLAQDAGSLSVFDIEAPIFAGNFIEAVRVGRRSDHGAAIGLLYRKVHLIYRVACVLKEDPGASNQTLSEILGIKGGQIYYIAKAAKSTSLEQLEEFLAILGPLSSATKRGELLLRERFEVAIFELCQSARRHS